MTSVSLNIYGITVRIQSTDEKIIEWVKFDFRYFLANEKSPSDIEVDFQLTPPIPSLIPPIAASVHSPKFVCYDKNQNRFVDYFGRALIIHDRKTESARLFTMDLEFGYEKMYLFVLSRVGEKLDRRGFHRVHAVGFTYQGKGGLILLPERGGKSTLAMAMIRQPDIKIVSEDTPLIDQKGTLYPFPIRFGLRDGDVPEGISPTHLRSFPREQGDVKHLITTDYFGTSIESKTTRLRWVFIGNWIYSDTPEIQRSGFFKTLKALIRDCVFGLGLPQVVEFFLRSSAFGHFSKMGIFLRRIFASARISLTIPSYEFLISRDKKKNVDRILDFLHSNSDS